MRLFISYAHVDKWQVSQLVEILRDAGQEPWFDHNLIVGRKWQEQLHESITKCDAFLYALTPEAVASEWCQWEFVEAIKLEKPIIPVLLQSKTNLPPPLDKYQYADFTEGITGKSVAKLMGGLMHLRITIPLSKAPVAPKNPKGIPANAPQTNVGTYVSSMPRRKSVVEVSAILPPPFEWCHITQGIVILENESARGGTSGGRYEIPSFKIAKYPITNLQYHIFLDEPDGYEDEGWWSYSRAAEAWRKSIRFPETSESPYRDSPRNNVCWYEAIAFCHWLTYRTGQTVTLPTEQQWQRAAQGDDNRMYPWGNKFYEDRCNYGMKIRQPTSVTQYAAGASPFDVMDMSGNIWEWCLTEWATDSSDITNSFGHRILRGGSWDNQENEVRCGYRLVRNDPSNFGRVMGFRIVSL